MAAWTTTPRTWTVGEVLTAANMNAQLRDFANGFAAWASYTPVWTSSGTAPVLNNGTTTGNYSQVQKTIDFRAALTLGSTSTIGTGAYSLSTPTTSVAGGISQSVTGLYFDSSTGFYYRGTGVINSGAATVTRAQFLDGVSSLAGWAATAPVVPATSDLALFCGTYESA